MKKINIIFYTIILLLGIFCVLIGIMASSESGIDSLPTVMGGGIFIYLGINIYLSSKEK